jgi:TolB protein
MRLLALFSLLGLSLLAPAQDRVVINDSIEGELQRGVVPVTVVSDDQAFGDQVRVALGAHGALSLRAGSSLRVTISRAALTATAACDNPRFAFQTSVEGRDEHDLILQVADAVVVGLGKRWQLKPLFAGTKVAFVSRYSGKQEIYVTNLARSRVLRLTNYQSSTNSPRWSADGARVYFVTSYRTGFPEILSSNGLGEAAKVITNVRGALGGASSGPDGRIAFASSSKGTMDIFVAGPRGESPRLVVGTDGVDSDPCWSPDGSRFALTSGPLGRPGIYLASSAGGGLTRVATGYGYSTEPRWNPVFANQIVFTYQSGGLGLGLIDLGAGTVAKIPAVSALNLSHASWCADGRHLVATQATASTGWIAVVDTVTGKVTRLSPSSMGDCSEPDCWVRR